MKATLTFIVAAVIGMSTFAPSVALAKKDPPATNAWNDSKLMSNRLHFRMPNGDVIVAKTAWMLFRRLAIEIHRNDKESGSVYSDLQSLTEVAAAGSIIGGAPETMKNLVKLVPLANTTNNRVNVVVFKGSNGLLVVGQITEVSPAAYFTHFIPDGDKNGKLELPNSLIAYVLPSTTGQPLSLQETAEIGVVLGYQDGKKVESTFTSPLYRSTPNPLPGLTTSRKPREADQPFLEIPLESGIFVIPNHLRANLSGSERSSTAPAEEVGMERVRAVRKNVAALRAQLESRVFGQQVAIDRFLNIYEQDEMNGQEKPTTLLFQGVRGSGKSFLASYIAKILGLPFMEIQGNRYSAHLGSLDYQSLVGGNGSPPQEGELITFLKGLEPDQKYFIQIDEGDKMHPEVWKLLMEFMNTGSIKDRHGTLITRKNAKIIITSNRGALLMFPRAVSKWTDEQILQRLRSLTSATLKGYSTQRDGLDDKNVLSDELMSRVREAIPFGPFTKDSARRVIDVAATDTLEFFERQHLVKMTVSKEVLQRAILAKWNPSVDARDLYAQTTALLSRFLAVADDKLDVKNGDQIDVSLDLTDPRVERYEVQVGERRTTYDVATAPSMNPLKNKVLRDRIANLYDRMKGRVMGQDEALKFVAQATKSHAMTPEGIRKPNVIGLLGASGNGKTETGRALADALYDGHLAILSMGDIGNDSAFETKFGGAASHQGGDVTREFEQALKDNPDGAVIVLDEITNMGGAHPQIRAALLRRLFGILDVGEFISPIDGRKYDLNKYTFILTGNAMEEAFLNVSSDDALLAGWEQVRGQESIQEHLLKMEIPNAFINRVMWNLMKPLLSYEVFGVTKKLWLQQIDALEKENPGLKITVPDGFFDRMSNTFFRASKGGRALRDVINKNVGGLLFDVLHNSGLDTDDLRGVEVRINLGDNQAVRPYITDKTPNRVVTFDASVIKDGRPINSFSVDVTSEAAEQVLMGTEAAKEVSFHEMGHGSFEGLTPEELRELGFNVNKMSDITGEDLRYITIRGGKMGNLKYYGYARTEPIKGAMLNPNHDRALISIAKLWAGSKAQELAGYPVDAGWQNDLEKIRSIATNYLTKWGLDREFIGIGFDKDGKPIIPPHLQARFGERMAELMDAGEKLAEKVVRMRWDFIRAGAAELLRKGEITADRIREIDANVKAAKASGRLKPNPRREPINPRPNSIEGGNEYRGVPAKTKAPDTEGGRGAHSNGFQMPEPHTCDAIFH